MSGIIMEIIKLGSVAYISQKALKCFGKKDYADVIAFCGWCGIGVNIYSLFVSLHNAIVNSEIVGLIGKINDSASKLSEWWMW